MIMSRWLCFLKRPYKLEINAEIFPGELSELSEIYFKIMGQIKEGVH